MQFLQRTRRPEGIGSGAVTAPFTAVEQSDVIIVIGSNPTENHPVAATFVKQAVRNGAELIVADPVSRLRTLGLLPKILSGTHIAEKEVSHAGVGRVTIEAVEVVPSHLDGEVMPPMTRFEIELLPGALDLL